MSIIIAIKEGDHIVMGCDSQITDGFIKTTTMDPFCKIWRVINASDSSTSFDTYSSDVFMAGVGDGRVIQLVSLMTDLIKFKDVKYDYLSVNLFDKLFDYLKSKGQVTCKERPCMPSGESFIIAYKDSAFLMDSLGFIHVINDYLVIGSGEEIAIGSLEATKHLDAKERIKIAIKICSDKVIYVDNNIYIMDTRYGIHSLRELPND